MKTFSKTALVLAVSLALPTITYSTSSHAYQLSKQQVIKDITYLASDELKGRASFSPEIDKAAEYIGKRFAELGLTPLAGEKSFLQTFSITNIQPKSLTVMLNGKSVASEKLGMASTMKQLHWQKNNDNVQTHFVGENDDMRAKLGELNQVGGEHLVIIHSKHERLFHGYSNYFARGLNKLSLEHQGAIVMVMSDEPNIESFDIKAETQHKTQQLTNVVGVLKGHQKPNENVLFSAHYDHLGTGGEGEDIIYNGADDDASGTTAVINLAEHYAKQGNNSRTLIFSAFTAEEIGGFGSKYFSEQLDPNSVVAMMNIEMIGKPSKFGAGRVWMTGMERSNLGELLNKSLPGENAKIHADPYPEQNLFYRSDNATLARLGVPAHSFSSTQLDKDQHYHQVSDDIASLDLDSFYQVIHNLSIASQGLVDGSITPTRVDTSKVRGKGKIY
ncbi:M20/M25/M40 family metallo-hydrolase [Thalassotalea fusca]